MQPNLGPDISTCSTSLPVTLNANAGAPGGAISYRWYTWNGSTKTLISGATGQTYSASSVGGYIVERDSAYAGGPCTKRDTIWITNSIPKPNLGADPPALCSPATLTLAASNAASFPGGTTWQWSKSTVVGGPYANISGATSSSLTNVREASYYRLVATSGTCTNSDTIRVTSSLPTPVDGCRSSAGTVSLAITNPGLNGTNYNWYSAATGGSPLAGGTGTTTFTTPSISTTTTYYVQDMSSVNGTAGPTTLFGQGQQWGCTNQHQLLFTATSNFQLQAFRIPYQTYGAGTGTVTIEILDNTNTVRATFTSDPVTTTGSSGGVASLLRFTFNGGAGVTIDRNAWGSNLKMRLKDNTCTVNGNPHWNDAGVSGYPFNSPGGIVSITGSVRSNGSSNTTDYMYFYHWEISTGNSCDRLPVIATIGTCSLPVELVNFYADNNSDHVSLYWSTAKEENNDRFEIERSADGISFAVIGKISGNGNKNSLSAYSYTDFEPVTGTSYYRLAQYNKDGSVTHSQIVAVERIHQSDLNLVPNPFSSSSELIVSSSLSAKVTVKISDISGKTVQTIEGYNTNEKINIGSDLPKGIYIVHVNFADNIITTRMIKQ
jgi:hypothetical protein